MARNTNMDIQRAELPHSVILEGRERLNISGVEDVESFDETSVVLYTSRGLMIVQGSGLHVDKLSIDGGEINIEGRVDAISYEDSEPKQGGFFSRLFR